MSDDHTVWRDIAGVWALRGGKLLLDALANIMVSREHQQLRENLNWMVTNKQEAETDGEELHGGHKFLVQRSNPWWQPNSFDFRCMICGKDQAKISEIMIHMQY